MTDHRPTAIPCPRHPHRPAELGLILCGPCVTGMLRDLAYVAAHWHHMLALHTSTSAHDGGRTVRADPPAPCRIDVLDHCRDLGAVLHAWTRLVCEDRQLVNPPREAPQQATWLRTHVEWLAAQPFGDEAASEIADTRWTLAAVIGDRTPGQRVACPLDECGTLLRVNVHDPDASVVCKGCGCTWTSGRLLLHAVSGDSEGWADAEAITCVVGVSERTLRRWAQAGDIRRANGRYLVADVVTRVRVGA